jgi:hypothetical protein
MKKLLFIVLFVSMISNAFAQKNLALGFHINQTRQDVALGIDVTSPMISHAFRLRLAVNQHYFDGIREGQFNNSSFTYQDLRLGFLGKFAIVEKHLNMYSEGGSLLLFNNPKMTDSKTNFGGYGLFGIEYAISRSAWMYFEMGGIGTGASAKKLLSSPSFSNGLLFGAGMRFYF